MIVNVATPIAAGPRNVGFALRLISQRVSISATHMTRATSQILRFPSRPDVLFIGEYHGANAGDMAMATALILRARRAGQRYSLQTLHNLDHWPDVPSARAIVGGGTVLTDAHLGRLSLRFGSNPKRLSILAVNFTHVSDLTRHRRFLRSIRRLTLRSQAQVDVARQVLQRNDVAYQPDPVFSLAADGHFCVNRSPDAIRPSMLGLSIMPLYHRFHGNRFVIDENFIGPKIVPWRQEASAYFLLVNALVARWQADFKRIVHIPFALEDWSLIALHQVPGSRIEPLPFRNSTTALFDAVAPCGLIIATRFHALVIALAMGIPVIPIPYGEKSVELLRDLGVKYPNRFSPLAAAAEPGLVESDVDAAQPLVLARAVIDELARTSSELIDAALND